MHQRIVEPLIRTFGSFHIRQLILEMDGREPRTLEVCRLTLADDPYQEVPLKTIHNSRIDLPWIVFAVDEYLDNLMSYMSQLDNERYEDADPERLAEGLRHLSEMSDERWAQLIAQEILTPHPRQRELMGVYHQRASEALRELRASHPEGISDKLREARLKNPELDHAFWGDAQHRLGFWRHELELPRRFTRIVGERVLQAGQFQVFEQLGYYDRTDVRLAALQQRDDGTWVNATYQITFKRDVSPHDPFAAPDEWFQANTSDEVGIGLFTDLRMPGVAEICEPIRAWLAEKREWQARDREWMANYMRTMQEQDPEAYEALVEAEGEDVPDAPDEEYQAVYDAWAALGCTDAPDDNADPVSDPRKEALKRAYPFNFFALL